MSDKIYMGGNVQSLHTSPQLEAYDGIEVIVSEEESFFAGNRNGNILQVSCPWGTQRVADDLLKLFQGYRYQPYAATEAKLDPAAEIGDGVTVGRVYGGLYRHELEFGGTMRSSFSAPARKVINHEFKFEPKKDRTVRRQLKGFQSTLKVQAGLIAAKVEAEGGDRKSFSWKMTTESHVWYSRGKEVVRFEEDNFRFEGTLIAKAGLIGGMKISGNCLYTGNAIDYLEVKDREVHVSPVGINLGGKFMVNSHGELYATSGTFTGTVHAGSISYGDDAGTLNGSGLSPGSVTGGLWGQIAGGTITTLNTVGGINTSLGYADYSHDIFSGTNDALYMAATTLRAQSNFFFRGKQAVVRTINGIDVLALANVSG